MITANDKQSIMGKTLLYLLPKSIFTLLWYYSSSDLIIRSIIGDVQQNLAKDYFAKTIPRKQSFSLSRTGYHLRLCQNNLTNVFSEGYRSKKYIQFSP
jgi:hypothetical protein